MLHLSSDIYFSIFKHLEFKDICNVSRTCKNLYMLKFKDKLWKYLFYHSYPHNLFYNDYTMYQNYIYHVIVQKIIDDNRHIRYTDYTYLFSQGTKRVPNHAMYIPILIPNENTLKINNSIKYALKICGLYNDIKFEPPNSIEISESTKYAFKKCDINDRDNIIIKYEYAVQYTNKLLKMNKMMIFPKKGDIAIFIDSEDGYTGGRDFVCYDRNPEIYHLIYNGTSFEHCPIYFTLPRIKYLNIEWPNVNIDYWYDGTWIHKNVIEQFKNNLTITDSLPFNIPEVNQNIYSKAELSGKTLYLFFYKDFNDVFTYDLDDIIMVNSTHASETHYLISEFGNKDGNEYILVEDPYDM